MTVLSAYTFFRWLFLNEIMGQEVRNFSTFPNSLNISVNQKSFQFWSTQMVWAHLTPPAQSTFRSPQKLGLIQFFDFIFCQISPPLCFMIVLECLRLSMILTTVLHLLLMVTLHAAAICVPVRMKNLLTIRIILINIM